MKLSKLEQESIILYNEEESTASIYTHDPKLKRKLKRLAEKYPLRQRPGAVQRRAAQGRQRTRQKRRIYAARKEYILRKRIRTVRPHRKAYPCAGAAILGVNSP